MIPGQPFQLNTTAENAGLRTAGQIECINTTLAHAINAARLTCAAAVQNIALEINGHGSE